MAIRPGGQDERGVITHRVYDVVTGSMTRQIVDVDTDQMTDVPTGWSTPTGGGLHLVTDYSHDDRGRIIQSLGPVHLAEVDGVTRQVRRASWNVYLDVDHEQRSAQGYRDEQSGTDTLVGPVSILRRNPKGHPLERITAVRSSSSGKLTAADTFSQSSTTSLGRRIKYSDCCTLISQRTYHTIPASGEGIPAETHYDETQFGYDSLKRRNRTVSPGGTIRLTVHNVRSQQVAMYVGHRRHRRRRPPTPTGGGAAGNDMTC